MLLQPNFQQSSVSFGACNSLGQYVSPSLEQAETWYLCACTNGTCMYMGTEFQPSLPQDCRDLCVSWKLANKMTCQDIANVVIKVGIKEHIKFY